MCRRRGNANQDKDIIQSVKLNDAKGKLSIARVIKHAVETQRLFQQHWPKVRLLQVQRFETKLPAGLKEAAGGSRNQAEVLRRFLESMGPFKTVMLSCQMRYELDFDLSPEL